MLNFLIGFFVGMASDPIPGQHRWAGVICKSSTEAYGSDDQGYCKAQSIIFLYVVAVSVLYMSCVIFDALYNIITLGKSTKAQKQRQIMLYVGSGVVAS